MKLLVGAIVMGAALPPAVLGDGVIGNFAPFFVDNDALDGRPPYKRAVGPIFEHRYGQQQEVMAVRPFWVEVDEQVRELVTTYSIYPLFTHWQRNYGYNWRVLSLMKGGHTVSDEQEIGYFELWPLIWHYDAGDPELNYDAVFPIHGTLKNRLFHKRIDWTAFPIYSRWEKQHHVDTVILWPIFRFREGPESRGWGVFPLFGSFERDNAYDNTYALWPFIYNNYRFRPGQEQPYHALGILPLYARETAAGLHSESYLWPFFGYTREWDPRVNYSEIRFFYPFIVQGRGEEKYVNRILPFYSHEERPNYEKTWLLWPFFRREERVIEEIALQTRKDTILFFLYWDELQQNVERNFHARKTHVWPFYSYWNDGSGNRQLQALSPLEVFFPNNQGVRETWNPFFALYRYDLHPKSVRHSALWDLVLYERDESGKTFSIGPIYERKRDNANDSSSWSVLKGLIGVRREQGSWKVRGLWGLFGRDEAKGSHDGN